MDEKYSHRRAIKMFSIAAFQMYAHMHTVSDTRLTAMRRHIPRYTVTGYTLKLGEVGICLRQARGNCRKRETRGR